MEEILNKKLDSDEESDDDYVPTQKELNEDEKESKFKKGIRLGINRKRTIGEIVSEMKEEWENSLKQSKKKEVTIDEVNIKEILERINRDKQKAQVIKFAGKTFNLSEDNECKMIEGPAEEPEAQVSEEKEKEKPAEEILEIEEKTGPKVVTLGQKFEYVKNLLKIIDAKHINSMTKSRYDWKDYAKKENMEKQFAENRKDGYLEKMKFLEKSKQEEKDYNQARKKLKTS